jgi:hypothetical protein
MIGVGLHVISTTLEPYNRNVKHDTVVVAVVSLFLSLYELEWDLVLFVTIDLHADCAKQLRAQSITRRTSVRFRGRC